MWLKYIFIFTLYVAFGAGMCLEPSAHKTSHKILITGANGWIGQNAYIALQGYQFVLVDITKGKDTQNRFGMENANQARISGLQEKIIIIDLSTNKGGKQFKMLLKKEKPDCVIHLAGALENRSLEEIAKNNLITRNVLDGCSQEKVKLIAASSIMLLHGAAIKNVTIRAILTGDLQAKPDKQITSDDALENSREAILTYGEDKLDKYLAYVRTKEYLEKYGQKLTEANPGITMIMVRFGWTGIKNPYELEKDAKIKESTVYLTPEDLQEFLKKLVDAVIGGKIAGYKKYIAVSEHPQRWVSLKNVEDDLGWKPTTNIKDKYTQ